MNLFESTIASATKSLFFGKGDPGGSVGDGSTTGNGHGDTSSDESKHANDRDDNDNNEATGRSSTSHTNKECRDNVDVNSHIDLVDNTDTGATVAVESNSVLRVEQLEQELTMIKKAFDEFIDSTQGVESGFEEEIKKIRKY